MSFASSVLQVEGTIAITGLKGCDLVVWTQKDMTIERIPVDEKLWTQYIKLKLQKFFASYVLPELVDPCYPDNEIVERNLCRSV